MTQTIKLLGDQGEVVEVVAIPDSPEEAIIADLRAALQEATQRARLAEATLMQRDAEVGCLRARVTELERMLEFCR